MKEKERLFEFSVESPDVSVRKIVYFLGNPSEVLSSVEFRDASDRFYTPRPWVPLFLSPLFDILSLFVSFLENFSYTTAVVSLTLAFFNALPISLTDGTHIWKLLFEMYVFPRYRRWKKFFPYFIRAFNGMTIVVVLLTWLRGSV